MWAHSFLGEIFLFLALNFEALEYYAKFLAAMWTKIWVGQPSLVQVAKNLVVGI